MQLKIYKNVFNSLFIRKVGWPSLKNTWINLSAIIILLFIFPTIQYGQASALVDNTLTPMTTDNLPGVVANTPVIGGFSSKNNITDTDLNNTSNYTFLIAGSSYIEAEDPNATGGQVYPIGSFAGVVIADATLLAVFGSSKVDTYLGASPRESFSSSALISTGILGGKAQLGFITTMTFNKVRFTYTAIGAGTISVYYMVVEKFGTGAALNCNTITALSNPSFPVAINANHTGFTGIDVLASFQNTYNVVSPSSSDYVTLTPGLLGVAATSSISVRSQTETYGGPKLVGFEIENINIANLSILNNLTINTYIGGGNTPVQTATGADLLLSATLLSNSGKQKISFLATSPFDEIQLQIFIPVGVDLGETRIYNAFVEEFCAGEALVCNTPKSLNSALNPLYINLKRTNVTGAACAFCDFYDFDKVIDGITSTPAVIDITASVGAKASLSVRNALEVYPANTLAGFDIETGELVGVDVATGIRINFYNNNLLVHTSTNPNLLAGVGSSLLTGRARQKVGVVCPVSFDEIQVSFETLADVSLGVIYIYDFFIQHNCAVEIPCNSVMNMIAPGLPVVIDFERTGVTGLACVACEVEDPWNLLDADLTNFAKINTSVGAVAESAIAILDPIQTYYPGTYVGFSIKKGSFAAAAGLFNYVTITTYNNGQVQETMNAANLIDLSLIVLTVGIPDGTYYNIGFQASKSFDEVKISYGNLIGALDTYIEVYGAFIDTGNSLFSGGTNPGYCFKTNPDFNVAMISTEISGDVSTNDIINDGPGDYSNPVPDPLNPSGGTIMLNSDGTYTFTGTEVGIYTYFITVCEYEALDGCRQERLTITVKSENESDSPTANTDIAVVNGDDDTPETVIINVRANDEIGNEGGVLDIPDIKSPPSNGIATINPDGTISYIPNDGFYGIDVFTYEVCETPGGLCATALVEVTVLPGEVVNTTSAADDFVDTDAGVAVTGNVAMNDTDPEGDTQTVGAYTSTVAAGTLVMEADGDYTFTPATGFSGSVDFVYTICDDQVPVRCADATLHILVKGSAVPDLTPTITLTDATFGAGETKALVVNIIEFLGKPTNDQTEFTLRAPPGYVISSFDPNMVDITPSGSTNRLVNNIDWHQVSLTSTKLVVKANTATIIAGTTRAVLGFNVTRVSATTGSTGNISATITDDISLGYDSNGDNNLIIRILTNQ